MKILLDTADINYVQMLHDLYPIDGVTTNPTILAKNQAAWHRGAARNIGGDRHRKNAACTTVKHQSDVSSVNRLEYQ